MKVILSLKPLQSQSKTRGIGVYTKELLASLQKRFPKDTYIPTSHDYHHENVDLIHFPFFDPFFRTMPRGLKIPMVVTIHDLIPIKFPQQFPKGIRGFIKWNSQKRTVKKADHIITDSISSKRDIMDILDLPTSKITVIPLSASFSKGSPAKLKTSLKKKYNLPDKYILYVGDINWNKNIVGLIKEFEKVKDSSVHLLLIGKAFSTGSGTKELTEIKRLISESSAKGRIRRLGYVPSHHLPAFYEMATIYIQPSWYEGFGLPILEAMQSGCPVIASRTGSLPEVGGKAVLYINPSTSGSIRKSIDKLLTSSKARNHLKELGIARAKQFSWAKTAEATRKVYEKVVGNT